MNEEDDKTKNETLELTSLVVLKNIKEEFTEDFIPIFLATLVVAQLSWFGYVIYNWNSIVN